MVQMDIIKRKKHSVIISVLYSLIFFSILYITVVRPARVYVNRNYIAPLFQSLEKNQTSFLSITPRRVNIHTEVHDSPIGFGMPFGGYFWLPFSLFISVRQKWPAVGLTLYHISLGIIPPFLTFLFIKHFTWAGSLLKINEILFQGIFLISLFWGIKSILVVNKKEMKKSKL
jgi:hypothetical protein